MLEWRRRNEPVHEQALAYDAVADDPETKAIYQFGEGVVDGEDLTISSDEIRIPGFGQPVRLDYGVADRCRAGDRLREQSAGHLPGRGRRARYLPSTWRADVHAVRPRYSRKSCV